MSARPPEIHCICPKNRFFPHKDEVVSYRCVCKYTPRGGRATKFLGKAVAVFVQRGKQTVKGL